MAGNLVAGGIILGLGFVIHELSKKDRGAAQKAKGIPNDPHNLINQCLHDLKHTLIPKQVAAQAAYNAAFEDAGGKSVSKSSNDDSKVINPGLDAAGQAALDSAVSYWNIPYLPSPEDAHNWEGGLDNPDGTFSVAQIQTGAFPGAISNTYGNYGIQDYYFCDASYNKKEVVEATAWFQQNPANTTYGGGVVGLYVPPVFWNNSPASQGVNAKTWYAPGYNSKTVLYDSSDPSLSDDPDNVKDRDFLP